MHDRKGARLKERSRKLHDDDAKLGRPLPLLPFSPFFSATHAAKLKQGRDRPGMFFFEPCVFGAGVEFCQCVGKLWPATSVYPSVRAITLFFFFRSSEHC
jgi:hypothetical protein